MEQIPDRLAGRPSWLINQLAVHAHRLASDGFAKEGARGYHYRILATLTEFGPGSQADLGRRCNMDRSDVAETVNQLTEHGHIERTPDPDDRRRNIVTITKAGERQLRRLDRAIDKVQDDFLGPLPAEDRQTLTRLLTTLFAHHNLG